MALCALACLLGVSTAATAQEPEPEASESEAVKKAAQQESPEREKLGYILLGTSFALGLGMVGGYFFVRRRQRRDEALFDFEDFAPVNEADFSNHRRMVASGRRRDGASDGQGSSPDSVLEALGTSEVDFTPQQQLAEPKRECPKCSRTFPATILVCPYDSVALRPAHKKTARRRRQKRADGLERLVCTGCERRYGLGVDYCYHDGLPLMQDTRERADHAPTFKACEKCGWEGVADNGSSDEAALCPNDGHELVAIDPSDSTHVQPTIPMTICPTCREYGKFGVAFCPNDGDVLMPVINMRVTEFPARGFGPRRKVCSECGTEHSGQAAYCSQDGSKLVSLN